MKKLKITFLCLVFLVNILLSSTGGTTALATVTHANKIDENTTVARTIAEEGTVLLKNDYGVLPLKPTDSVAGLGIAQDTAQVFGGGGSGWVNATDKITYREGLENAASNGLIKQYTAIGAFDWVGDYNKALYFISRSPTEGADLTEDQYYLTDVEKNDISGLVSRYGKQNVVVVLNVGSVVDTSWLLEQDVAGIVLAYLGGEQAGNALASVLTGAVNPSGKLVDTWAESYNDYPSSNGSGIGTFAGDKNTYYTEDIYVGYRYFATFDPNYERVNFEFGFGLSYTEFSFSDYNVVQQDDKFTVSVTVTNVGACAGKEVVQVYFGSPAGKLYAPSAELVAFKKTSLLQPNQSERVEMTFSLEEFARYDDSGKISLNSWVIEAGDYPLYVGNSIKNAVSSGAVYCYTSDNDVVVEQTTALRDTMLLKRLLGNGEFEIFADAETAGVYTVPSAGSVLIQAENYTSMTGTGTSEIYHIGADSGFGLGNLNKPNNVVTYKLNVEQAGQYRIAFNMASAWNGQVDMFDLYVNGQLQNITVNMDATHADGDAKWYACEYLTSDAYTITLPQGEVELTFRSTNLCFMNIDSFVIFNDKVSGDKVTTIQAENFTYSTLGTEMIANGTATERSNADGNVFEYTLDVEQAGTYYLSMLVSNVTAAQRDALGVYIDGVKQEVSLDVMRTAASGDVLESNYHKFIGTNSVALELPAGRVTLKFVTQGSAVCCIDSFTLTPSAIYQETPFEFVDNTEQFHYVEDTSGTELDQLITFDDVYADPSLMDAFLSQLSIEELAYLLGLDTAQNDIGTGVGGVGGMNLDDKYGIPSAYTADGPAGIRYGANDSLYATWFPCMTMLASTWNTQLAQDFGNGLAQEAVLGGVTVWLAPGVNIHRNPLCGRNFEYFSEDPLISGLFGAEITKAVQSHGVMVCVKHYCANNQETNRFGNNSCVSARALREIYLKSFELVVKLGDPGCVMSSYNMVNGLHVAASYDLMTEVLRNEWGFDGAVFSDWGPHMSHISLVLSGNTFKSMTPEYDTLVQAYKSGILTRDDFERNAKDAIQLLIGSSAGGQQTTMINATGTTYITDNCLTRSVDNESGRTEFYRISIQKSGYYVVDTRYSKGTVSMHSGEIDLTSSEAVWIEAGKYEFEIQLNEGDDFGTISFTYYGDNSQDDDTPDENPDGGGEGTVPSPEPTPQPLPTGAVVGIVAGAVVVVAGISVALYFAKKRKN